MKGLILKDYYCLKKSLGMIFLVSFGTIFLAVLFTLSAKYGNVARAIADTGADYQVTEKEFYSFYRYVIWIVLLIPMAFAANVTDCFREDWRAGFSRVLFTFPRREYHVAGARYLSCLLYLLVGAAASSAAAVCVSLASERLALPELLSIVLTFAGVMLLFVAVVMPLIYLLGADKTDLIWCGVLLLAAAVLLYACRGQLGELFGNAGRFEEGEAAVESMTKVLDDFYRMLTTEGGLLFAAGAAVFFLSFLCSVFIMKERRGQGV